MIKPVLLTVLASLAVSAPVHAAVFVYSITGTIEEADGFGQDDKLTGTPFSVKFRIDDSLGRYFPTRSVFPYNVGTDLDGTAGNPVTSVFKAGDISYKFGKSSYGFAGFNFPFGESDFVSKGTYQLSNETTLSDGTYLVLSVGKVGENILDNALFIKRPNGAKAHLFLSFGNPTLVAAVPEPATWGLMIVGFGMVGGAMRRSRGPYRSVARLA